MTLYYTLPLRVTNRRNEYNEPCWFIVDKNNVTLLTTGHWPLAADDEMRALLHRMVAAVNELPPVPA